MLLMCVGIRRIHFTDNTGAPAKGQMCRTIGLFSPGRSMIIAP